MGLAEHSEDPHVIVLTAIYSDVLFGGQSISPLAQPWYIYSECGEPCDARVFSG